MHVGCWLRSSCFFRLFSFVGPNVLCYLYILLYVGSMVCTLSSSGREHEIGISEAVGLGVDGWVRDLFVRMFCTLGRLEYKRVEGRV